MGSHGFLIERALDEARSQPFRLAGRLDWSRRMGCNDSADYSGNKTRGSIGGKASASLGAAGLNSA
jgi:hypothetical protein